MTVRNHDDSPTILVVEDQESARNTLQELVAEFPQLRFEVSLTPVYDPFNVLSGSKEQMMEYENLARFIRNYRKQTLIISLDLDLNLSSITKRRLFTEILEKNPGLKPAESDLGGIYLAISAIQNLHIQNLIIIVASNHKSDSALISLKASAEVLNNRGNTKIAIHQMPNDITFTSPENGRKIITKALALWEGMKKQRVYEIDIRVKFEKLQQQTAEDWHADLSKRQNPALTFRLVELLNLESSVLHRLFLNDKKAITITETFKVLGTKNINRLPLLGILFLAWAAYRCKRYQGISPELDEIDQKFVDLIQLIINRANELRTLLANAEMAYFPYIEREKKLYDQILRTSNFNYTCDPIDLLDLANRIFEMFKHWIFKGHTIQETNLGEIYLEGRRLCFKFLIPNPKIKKRLLALESKSENDGQHTSTHLIAEVGRFINKTSGNGCKFYMEEIISADKKTRGFKLIFQI